MSESEIFFAILMLVAATLSAIAAIGSLIAAIYAVKNSRKLASSQTEMTIRQQINEAEKYKDDKIVELMKAGASGKAKETLQKVVDSAVQRLLNIYDDACGQYIDGKIDRKRFRKNFEFEICNNVKNPDFAEYYIGVEKEYYQKTLRVYNEWTKKE